MGFVRRGAATFTTDFEYRWGVALERGEDRNERGNLCLPKKEFIFQATIIKTDWQAITDVTW